MFNNCFCSPLSNDNQELLLLQQIKSELKKITETNEGKFLCMNGKISELYNYLHYNLTNSIRGEINAMEISGKLNSIIETAIISHIEEITKRDVYYNNINTKKVFDDISNTYYYVTIIPRNDEYGNVIPLQMGFANDDIRLSSVESTLDFAHRNNATVCINAGIFDVATSRPVGVVIKDGAILQETPVTDVKYGYFGITFDNNYRFYEENTPASRMILDGCKDVVCIFNSLIRNGIHTIQTDDRKEPRQSIGIRPDKSLVIITCDGRDEISEGMSYTDLARLHAEYSCHNAYILDGGGSSSTVVRGIKQNESVDYLTVDRKVTSFLYIAKETVISPENNPANDLGKVKHSLIERIVNKMDFIKGFIRLKHSGFAPGIEMYVNNEEKRRSKWGITVDSANPRNTYAYIGIRVGESEKTNLFRVYDQGVWCKTYSGPSSDRPNGIEGLQYFDTTIGKPIWYTGSKWVDSTGTTV